MAREPTTAVALKKTNLPDRSAIRAEWYAIRDDFHALLEETEDVWDHRAASIEWTVGEIFGHLLHEMESIPEMVERANAGKDLLNLPSFIVNPLNYLHTRLVSRNETPHSVAEQYDEYFKEALAALDQVEDHEWDRGANFFGEGYWTVEDVFRNVPGHFEEHAAQIREVMEQVS